LKNLALRQQLAVFKRQNSRPRLTVPDKLFWLLLRRLWCSWKKMLIVVSPDTVVRWHRGGFRFYWRLISRGASAGLQKTCEQGDSPADFPDGGQKSHLAGPAHSW
jgi:hypothetical protein